MRPRRVFLLGPTAAGKTAVAVALARRLDAEILSMDSMLVYRGMDIGTAKPSLAERAAVRHHLLDLVAPNEEFSVARYLEAAAAAQAGAPRALFVGGTGLYLKALTAGMFEGPSVPPEVRAQVEAQLASAGRDALRAELQRHDPVLHARLHPNDDQRLLRAVETFRATGRPLSSWQRQWTGPARIGEPAAALHLPREVLRERVAARFDAMLAAGFLDEVRRIRDTCGFSRSAAKALGYRQLLEHLEGRCSLAQARERAITLSRTLIRRQMTWLRSFPDLRWVPAAAGEAPEALAARVAHALSA
ncbi:MAG: tRNA (adenosine(37)-N6)-dimethylallyltransferase MiaA [Planctomycetota bacterium]|nr:MAG: tRNA (adenosine(37)-N6)-dimethylallyltransferase MiaA [Planctomycetota bacterium]